MQDAGKEGVRLILVELSVFYDGRRKPLSRDIKNHFCQIRKALHLINLFLYSLPVPPKGCQFGGFFTYQAQQQPIKHPSNMGRAASRLPATFIRKRGPRAQTPHQQRPCGLGHPDREDLGWVGMLSFEGLLIGHPLFFGVCVFFWGEVK